MTNDAVTKAKRRAVRKHQSKFSMNKSFN